MRHTRILWSAVLAAAVFAAAFVPAMAQNMTITDAHQAIRTALDSKDFPTVWQRSHDIMAATAKRDPASLTGPELYAISVAHYYLVAESLDNALKAGNLTPEQVERANAMRARIMGIDRQPAPVAEAPLPPVPTAPVMPVAPVAGATVPSLRTVSHGQEVNVQDYLAPGKTTIFDFYSEFCGPCRQMAPKLEALIKARPDLALVKVDINRPGMQSIDWQSPVSRQYRLESIPHLKVYGADGKLIAEGNPASQLVTGWCEGQ